MLGTSALSAAPWSHRRPGNV